MHLADRARRKQLLDEIAGEDVLYGAAEIVLAFAVTGAPGDAAGDLVAAGMAVQTLRVALAAEGLGSCVVPVAAGGARAARAAGGLAPAGCGRTRARRARAPRGRRPRAGFLRR